MGLRNCDGLRVAMGDADLDLLHASILGCLCCVSMELYDLLAKDSQCVSNTGSYFDLR